MPGRRPAAFATSHSASGLIPAGMRTCTRPSGPRAPTPTWGPSGSVAVTPGTPIRRRRVRVTGVDGGRASPPVVRSATPTVWRGAGWAGIARPARYPTQQVRSRTLVLRAASE